MTAIENVLNQDVGLTSTPEEINRTTRCRFARMPRNQCLPSAPLGKETKVSKGEVAAVLFFSGRVHVWAVLREDVETSVRVWDFDGMREWSVRERRRDIGAAKVENTKVKEGREEEMASIGDQNTTEGRCVEEEERIIIPVEVQRIDG